MASDKQKLGNFGQKSVVNSCPCPKCKRNKTLKTLPNNFKCANIICDFCGYLAEVKTSKTTNIEQLPKSILGAAWKTQKERMDAGIYFPLFIVLIDKHNLRKHKIYYLPADLQTPELFEPRKPLSSIAQRKQWQGFRYNLEIVKESIVSF
ncbi:DpnI domain-containing protein [Rhodovibrionaceae bacterium A322]